MEAAFLGLITIILGVGGCVGYYFFANLLLDRFVFPRAEFDAEDARKRTRVGLAFFFIAPIVAYFLLSVMVPWVTAGGGFITDGWNSLQSVGGAASGALPAFWAGLAGVVTGALLIAVSVALGILGFALVVFAFVLLVAFIRILLSAIGTHGPALPRAFFGGLAVMIVALIVFDFGVSGVWLAVLFVAALVAVIWAVLRAMRAQGQLVPASTPGENINNATALRPWLFLFPAIFALGLYLAYPVYETLSLSLTERLPGGLFRFVGFDNYSQMFGEPKFWEALRNNFFWLLVVPAMSTAFGLLAAQLTDRIKWGNLAKSMIFMPMAISFVGAAVIWKLIYDTRPVEQDQIGVLNAIFLSIGGDAPITWLTVPFWNSFMLMAVLIWIQTGFAMVILSAALRGIPEETIEAAIIDGASPLQVFFRIKMPQIATTIVVVWTTITLVVLKVFDIVFAMTNGQWETQVLANYMYDKLFRANDWGVGSASAMIIMLLVMPILVWNVRNARKEMR